MAVTAAMGATTATTAVAEGHKSKRRRGGDGTPRGTAPGSALDGPKRRDAFGPFFILCSTVAGIYIAGMPADMKTPDHRYLVVNGRLWRAANPALPADARVRFTRDLMAGRRAVRAAKESGDEAALQRARASVNAAKVALGERGAVWWTDGAPDLNRTLVKNSPYAAWYEDVETRGQVADAFWHSISAGSPAPVPSRPR